MVVVETKLEALKKLSQTDDIEDALFKMGMELEGTENGTAKVEITAERIDMLTPEGLARAIRAYTGKHSEPERPKSSGFSIHVERVSRPFIACCVVRGVSWTQDAIKETMNAHDKLNRNYGRQRKKAAIGIYDISGIKFPLKYCEEDKRKIRFLPLGGTGESTGEEILLNNPKGVEYASLVPGHRAPVIKDVAGKVISMPPIVNAKEFEVTEKTRDVFMEVTGTHRWTVETLLSIISSSLEERGGRVETMEVVYPEGRAITPLTEWKRETITADYVNGIFGTSLSAQEIANLLERMLYKASVSNGKINVLIPPYRSDILHKLDIADDVGRAYGFHNLVPETPKLPCTGSVLDMRKLSRKASEIMIGFGFQEIMTFVLTNKKDQFEKMNIPAEECVEILNAKEGGISIARKRVLPELLKALSFNLHRPFPQRFFEIGDVVSVEKSDTGASDRKCIAAVVSDSRAGYESISVPLCGLLGALGIEFKLEKTEHPSFIAGRVASIAVNGKRVGIVGEINPQVLENCGIDNPCAAFEAELEKL
ncbi:MAG: phenylalanine--tRNA ligase subunit beta [Candidatus Aenigmarchaeota archaeon]|nr:phenylalanine--tRNA ligase subunit beta [Candidatus Aenigmarchaeota archaeon]